MKVIALSDTHGHLPDIPECDLVLMAGDICPHFRMNCAQHQVHWLDSEFRYWLKEIKSPVFACAGNHDWAMQDKPAEVAALNLPWTYLQDQVAEFKGLRIYGSPWQERFFDWAFNLEEHELADKWAMIPDDVDVLITHSPPKFFGDKVLGRTDKSDPHVGSIALLKRVEIIKPQLHVYGHIHCGRGNWDYDGTRLANVAVVNEHYNMVHEPFEWHVEVKKPL